MTVALYVGILVVLMTALVLVSWRWLEVRADLKSARFEAELIKAQLAERTTNEETLKSAARAEFENLALQIFENKGRAVSRQMQEIQESSEKNLEKLLAPLKERLKDFEKKVEEAYQAEGRERHVLKAEVERLILLNERMMGEASHLTRALRGDNKVQGDWGELVLESILESSGLREGVEYKVQESFEGEDGVKGRPDVIVFLPDGKQILIDAKVTLSAYEHLVRKGDELSGDERDQLLNQHVSSFVRHVDGLAQRQYPKLKGLRTPEFVFLFTPIEPAYLAAMRHDPELATRAWKKGIAIVTATTLFTAMKIVESIWRIEHQNRNAQEIADQAAKLYDKFVNFYEDFEKVGKSLEASLTQFEDARKKLRDGGGNVFRKIEQLRELGAAPSKRIKPELLE